MTDEGKELKWLSGKEWERVRFLLDNPRIGQRAIGEAIREGRRIETFPNCLGAVAYCYGLKYDLLNPVSFDGDAFCFPIDDGPGFLDSSVFEKMLLEEFQKVPSPIVGDIVLFNNENRRPRDLINTNIGHAGIYLEQTGDDEAFLFEQAGYMGEMGIKKRDLTEWADGTFFTYYRRKDQSS